MATRDPQEVARLVDALRDLPHETPWLEFKRNNSDPEMIGRSISAIANSCRLESRATGFVMWGIRDSDHEIVGTTFRPANERRGNESLVNWLTHTLDPYPAIQFHICECSALTVVILEVPAAVTRPVAFRSKAYIRVGESTRELSSVPVVEQELWKAILDSNFERDVARSGLAPEEVLALLDVEAYRRLTGMPADGSLESGLSLLQEEGLVLEELPGSWAITNLGALLFAVNLERFPALARKAPRFIRYDGNSRVESASETKFSAGYALSFEPLMDEIGRHNPVSEVFGQALRTQVPRYPPIALRETVANSLVHQDFRVSGAGPLVEFFSDRCEVTNPGVPLVDADRFVDLPPKSRNESLAALLRRIGVCEERGSGWDKIASQVEAHQLPAPRVEVTHDMTRVSIFAPRAFGAMSRDERVQATYLHACLRHVSQLPTTNSSIRERFGIADQNAAKASRLLKDAVEAGRIKQISESSSRRLSSYVPYWA